MFLNKGLGLNRSFGSKVTRRTQDMSISSWFQILQPKVKPGMNNLFKVSKQIIKREMRYQEHKLCKGEFSRSFTLMSCTENKEKQSLLMGTEEEMKKVFRIAIIGQPNSGKSTLFNRLSRLGKSRSRALVSPLAGTTRDFKESLCNINYTILPRSPSSGFPDKIHVLAHPLSPNLGKSISGDIKIHTMQFIIYDTGGIGKVDEVDCHEDIYTGILEHVKNVMDNADVILVLYDARAGITSIETQLANILRKNKEYNKRCILIANKVDMNTSNQNARSTVNAPNNEILSNIFEGDALCIGYNVHSDEKNEIDITDYNFNNVLPISAEHGENIEELLERCINICYTNNFEKSISKPKDGKNGTQILSSNNANDLKFNDDKMFSQESNQTENFNGKISAPSRPYSNIHPKFYTEDDKKILRPIKVALVGCPNAGKSSILNAVLGYTRCITSNVSGTTRDSINAMYQYKDIPFEFIDTAGIRKSPFKRTPLEKLSIHDALRTVRQSDVVVLVLDGEQLHMRKMEKIIANTAFDEGKALVVAANKADLLEGSFRLYQMNVKQQLHQLLPQLGPVPVIPMSALYDNGTWDSPFHEDKDENEGDDETSLTDGPNEEEGKGGVKKLLPAIHDSYLRWQSRVNTSLLNKWLAGIVNIQPPPQITTKYNTPRLVKFKFISQVDVAPPTFVISSNVTLQDLPQSYIRFLKTNLQLEFNLHGTSIRLFVNSTSARNPYAPEKTINRLSNENNLNEKQKKYQAPSTFCDFPLEEIKHNEDVNISDFQSSNSDTSEFTREYQIQAKSKKRPFTKVNPMKKKKLLKAKKRQERTQKQNLNSF